MSNSFTKTSNIINDTINRSFNSKLSCRVASTNNIDINIIHDTLTIDDVVLLFNNRILLKNQTNPNENGVYTYRITKRLKRSDDMDSNSKILASSYFFIEEGTTNKD